MDCILSFSNLSSDSSVLYNDNSTLLDIFCNMNGTLKLGQVM
jgi:hypothetical protein